MAHFEPIGGPRYETFEERFLRQVFNPTGPAGDIQGLLRQPFLPSYRPAKMWVPEYPSIGNKAGQLYLPFGDGPPRMVGRSLVPKLRGPLRYMRNPNQLARFAYKWATPAGEVLNLLDIAGQALDYMNPSKWTGPRGYQFPWSYWSHWGEYNCGVTLDIRGQTVDGFLNENTFKCLPGQTFNDTEISGVRGKYLDLKAGMWLRSGLVLGRWNGVVGPAQRMTVTEFYWYQNRPGLPGTGTQHVLPQNLRIPYGGNNTAPAPRVEPPPAPFNWPRETVYPQNGGPINKPPGPPPYVGPDGHTNLPRRREEKWKIKYGLLHQIYGALTEYQEMVECAEKAFKKGGGKVRHWRGLHDRTIAVASAIAKDPQKFQPGVFIPCMVQNAVGDHVIGKFNQLANQITKSPYWVRPVGPGSGSWSHRMR